MSHEDASLPVRMFPEEWRQPIALREFSHVAKTRDVALEYRLLRVLTENQKMVNRLFQPSIARTGKDRYRDILPFVDNRVVLKVEKDGCSDYVNASWMPNSDGSNLKAYIATQGPLEGTLCDHWRTVLENDVKAIFAIGGVLEGTVEKFYQYWPAEIGQTLSVGQGVSITLTAEEQLSASFVKRTLLVNDGGSGGSSLKKVVHYHFSHWPDHSSMEPHRLLELVGCMRWWRKNFSEFPVLVHCSAGVGRTGCALTMCNVIEDLERKLENQTKSQTNESISILEHAIHLRRYRLYMMQTTSQYESVFRTTAFLLDEWFAGNRASLVEVPNQI